MSSSRDQSVTSSLGIQRIAPAAETPRRMTRRKPGEARDADRAPVETPHRVPLPPQAGAGRFVDKAV